MHSRRKHCLGGDYMVRILRKKTDCEKVVVESKMILFVFIGSACWKLFATFSMHDAWEPCSPERVKNTCKKYRLHVSTYISHDYAFILQWLVLTLFPKASKQTTNHWLKSNAEPCWNLVGRCRQIWRQKQYRFGETRVQFVCQERTLNCMESNGVSSERESWEWPWIMKRQEMLCSTWGRQPDRRKVAENINLSYFCCRRA
jgi:hypothetical protein